MNLFFNSIQRRNYQVSKEVVYEYSCHANITFFRMSHRYLNGCLKEAETLDMILGKHVANFAKNVILPIEHSNCFSLV